MASIQEVLRRIQEEAKRKVAVSRYRYSEAPAPVEVPVKAERIGRTEPVDLGDAVKSLRENITTAVAKAISTKAARRYISDITERVQDLATAAVANVQADNDFGANAQDETGIILYPKNCKLLVIGNNGYGSLVIEEPPQLRTIYGPGGRTYRVPMPYVVFLVGFHHTKMYELYGFGVGFGIEPLESIDQRMQLPRIPHTGGNTHVCQPMNHRPTKTVKELSEDIIHTFWNTAFHYDFGRNLGRHDSKFALKDGRRVNNFKDWQKIGDKNPLDILTGQFGQGDTVRSVLKNFGRIETRDRNTANNRIQGAVARMVNGINESLGADALAEIIRQTAEEIVNAALQNAVGISALQPGDAVV